MTQSRRLAFQTPDIAIHETIPVTLAKSTARHPIRSTAPASGVRIEKIPETRMIITYHPLLAGLVSHRSRVGGPSAGYSLSVPIVGLGLDGSAAEDSGGAELCSLAPPDVSAVPDEGFMASAGFASLAAPDEGGAELCSLAPVEVSAPPDGVA
jgi:hypothetical protein